MMKLAQLVRFRQTHEIMIKVRVLIVEVHTIVVSVLEHLSLVTNETDIGHRAEYCEWVSPHNSNNTERKRDNYQNRNSWVGYFADELCFGVDAVEDPDHDYDINDEQNNFFHPDIIEHDAQNASHENHII